MSDSVRKDVERINAWARAAFDHVRGKDDLLRTSSALLAVLEMHRRAHGAFRDWCEVCSDEEGVAVDWPCPTVQAIEQHMSASSAPEKGER